MEHPVYFEKFIVKTRPATNTLCTLAMVRSYMKVTNKIDRNLACAGITDFYRSRSVSRDKHPTD